MNIEIIEIETLTVDLLGQVDRSETVHYVYQAFPAAEGFGLTLEKVRQEPAMAISPWSEAGIRKRIRSWQPEIEKGGRAFAALDGAKTAAFGVLGPVQPDDSTELCALFVSTEYRRTGLGATLFRKLEKAAAKAGASAMLIYSNPTESSVDFYRKQGCEIIGLADKRLVSHLPWDVVFAKRIEPDE